MGHVEDGVEFALAGPITMLPIRIRAELDAGWATTESAERTVKCLAADSGRRAYRRDRGEADWRELPTDDVRMLRDVRHDLPAYERCEFCKARDRDWGTDCERSKLGNVCGEPSPEDSCVCHLPAGHAGAHEGHRGPHLLSSWASSAPAIERPSGMTPEESARFEARVSKPTPPPPPMETESLDYGGSDWAGAMLVTVIVVIIAVALLWP